jgi:hypothetical protein
MGMFNRLFEFLFTNCLEVCEYVVGLGFLFVGFGARNLEHEAVSVTIGQIEKCPAGRSRSWG